MSDLSCLPPGVAPTEEAMQRHWREVRARLMGGPAPCGSISLAAGLAPPVSVTSHEKCEVTETSGVMPVYPVPAHARRTLEGYLVGPSNALAHDAATQIAADALRGGPSVGVVWGASGLGKSHLLAGVAARVEQGGGLVSVVDAARLLATLTPLKRAHLMAHSLVCIDDLARGAQADEAGRRLGALIADLLSEGVCLMVASERPISEMDSLPDRTRGRLLAGYGARIEPMESDLVLRVVQARAQALGCDLGAAALVHVASFAADGRAVEGALTRLAALRRVQGRALGLDEMDAILADLSGGKPAGMPRVDDIIAAVCRFYAISRADLISQRRTDAIVKPRQIAMWLAKTMTIRSLPEIGRRFGGRDHTTVLHAVRKIEDLKRRDARLAGDLDALSAALLEGRS